MKAKQSVVLISTLVAGIVLVTAVFAEEAESFELGINNVQEINVDFGGWKGRFLPDGTAKLQRSNANIEFWERVYAPEGSFSFEDIYALVAPHLKVESAFKPKESLIIGFFFDRSNDTGIMHPYVFFYIEDKQVARTLMHGLRAKAEPRDKTTKTYFEGLYSKYPLVPGEEPAPFRYDSSKRERVGIIIFAVVYAGAVLWLILKNNEGLRLRMVSCLKYRFSTKKRSGL